MRQVFVTLLAIALWTATSSGQPKTVACDRAGGCPNPVVRRADGSCVCPDGQIEGKVASWDATTKTLTLEDGTQLSVPANVTIAKDRLRSGASVSVSYEDKDGKKVLTSIEK